MLVFDCGKNIVDLVETHFLVDIRILQENLASWAVVKYEDFTLFVLSSVGRARRLF
jgi:hypothetical protein